MTSNLFPISSQPAAGVKHETARLQREDFLICKDNQILDAITFFSAFNVMRTDHISSKERLQSESLYSPKLWEGRARDFSCSSLVLNLRGLRLISATMPV